MKENSVRANAVLTALSNAKQDGKLDIVSAVSGITLNRLEQIIENRDMTLSEESILSIGL